MQKNYKLYIIIILSLLFSCDVKNNAPIQKENLYIKLIGTAKFEDSVDFLMLPDQSIMGIGNVGIIENGGLIDKFFIFKTDPLGNKQWIKVLEEGNAQKMILDAQNNNIIILFTSTPTIANGTDTKLSILKTDFNGDVVFPTRNYSALSDPNATLKASTINLFPNGNILMVGKMTQGTINNSRIFTLVTDNNGVEIRKNEYAYENILNEISDAVVLANGDVILCGTVANPLDQNILKLRLMNIDINGGIKWDFGFNDTDDPEISTLGTDLTAVAGGGFLCVGNNIEKSSNNDKAQGFMVKTSNSGLLEWKKLLSFASFIKLSAITPSNDGGFYVVGEKQVTSNRFLNTNILIAKINGNGDVLWQKDFGGVRNDVGRKVIATQDGGCLVLGTINFETNTMLGIIKLNANGDL